MIVDSEVWMRRSVADDWGIHEEEEAAAATAAVAVAAAAAFTGVAKIGSRYE